MAISVNDIYMFALDLIKKNQAGGLKPSSFQYQWNDAQSSYMDDLLGRFQLRSNGKTGLNTGLIEDETILQKISPFITNATVTITGGNGNKPTDFVYRLGLRINGYDCYKINYNQIASVNASVIDPPSATTNTYYFIEYLGYYTFLPTSVTSATLDYVAQPADVVWGYTIVSGREVYNSGTSTQPQWGVNSCREITKRMLANLGVAYKDTDFENFGRQVQTVGE